MDKVGGGRDPGKVAGERAASLQWRSPTSILTLLGLLVALIWLLSAGVNHVFHGGRWVESVSRAVTELDGLQDWKGKVDVELRSIRDDVSGIQDDMSDIRDDVSGIQDDVSDIKENLRELNDSLGLVRQRSRNSSTPEEESAKEGF